MIPKFPIKATSPFIRKLFASPAETLYQTNHNLPFYMTAADIRMDPKEYLVLGLANAAFMGLVVFSLIFLLAFIEGQIVQFLSYATLSAVGFGGLTALYWVNYPKIVANKRAELIEKELLFGLRDLSVELDAGIPFVDGLESLTDGYGELSNEVRRMTEDIRAGTAMGDALETSIHRNTSKIYRSAMIRIVNGVRSGADIPTLMSIVIENLAEEMKARVKRYGQEINLWATLYLIIGIVMPSMGLTLLVLLSSFTGLRFTVEFLYLVGFVLLVFHASAIGLLKSRRPLVEL